MRIILILLAATVTLAQRVTPKPICECPWPFLEIDCFTNSGIDFKCVEDCYYGKGRFSKTGGVSKTCSSTKHCGSWDPRHQDRCCNGTWDPQGNPIKKGCCSEATDICLGKCMGKTEASMATSKLKECPDLSHIKPIPEDADFNELLSEMLGTQEATY